MARSVYYPCDFEAHKNLSHKQFPISVYYFMDGAVCWYWCQMRTFFRIDFGTRWNYLRTWVRVLGNRRSMNCENKIKLWDTVWIISSVCILEKFEIVQRSFFSKIFLFSISGMKTKRLYSEICRSLQFSCIGGSTSQCYTWFRVDTQ